MKVLLIALLCGIATAAVVRDDSVFLDEALDEFDGVLSSVDKQFADIRESSKVGDFLKDALEKLVDRVKDAVDKLKDVAGKVTDKVEELAEKLRELEEKAKSKSKEAVDRLREKVREIVTNIKDAINKQVSVVAKELDEASYLRVRDLVKVIKNRVTDRIQAIQDYIKKNAENNEAAKQVSKLLDELKDSELAGIFDNLLDLGGHELRHIKDLYKQLKELAGKTDGVLKEKINSLLGYVQNLWKNGVERLVNRYRNLKGKLLEVVDKTKDFSVDAVKDALKNLEDYRNHLGDLYEKLVESLKEAIKKY